MCDTLLKSEEFTSYCLSETINCHIAKEFKGYFGIPDLMILDFNQENNCHVLRKAIAIELKLSNWRRAVEQAYRYKAFSDFVFVCIDAARIQPALMNLDYFKMARIGLLSFSVGGKLELLHNPPSEPPYSSALRAKLENEDFFSISLCKGFISI